MDLVTILTIISTVAGVVAIVQSARANRLSQRIAKVQGALTVPDLKIGFMGDDVIEHFYFAVPLAQPRVLEMPTVISFRNAGEKSARDVEVYMRLPRRLIFGGTGFAVITLNDPTERIDLRSVAQSEHTETFLLRIPTLHPDQRYVFHMRLSLSAETSLRHTARLRTKDDYELDVTFRIEVADAVDLMVSQADQRSFTRSLSLHVIDTAQKSVGDYFAELSTLAKSHKGRKGIVSSRFKVFEATASVIESDPDMPIDRVPAGADGTLYEGIRVGDRYVLTSAGVVP